MLRFGLVFLTVFISIGINLDSGFLMRMGFDPNILTVTLIALIITGLIAYGRLTLVILVIAMVMAANVPNETAITMGYDPDYILAALVAIVIAPLVGKHLNMGVFTSS